MKYSYFTFKHPYDARAVEIADLPDKVERYFYLRDGVPSAAYVPPSTELSLSEGAGDMLTDFIDNPDRVLYVSRRVQEVFSSRGLVGGAVELLPFVLLDKRGRRVQESYAIANPLMRVGCVDLERSKCRYRSGAANQIVEIKLLHVREDAIPEQAQLFRLAELPKLMVVRSDLLAAIQEAGLTGLAVHPVGMDIQV
ncbi:hypothetical protein HV824_12240 [Myxococcus sp. AM009]|uniref:imm11 family protein n=1 Tax=unclassified Myxococcus TaxID=2648731 RepID=UPI001595701F|nr:MULTISPECIES: DUF1629 domain-containing protein [unclassified Myxococcus]NVI98884.1 hypothetical protein [Myxococcus sp. AM009]NVJ17289.1 hypothetical protein [Myxococcus sp. AM010]